MRIRKFIIILVGMFFLTILTLEIMSKLCEDKTNVIIHSYTPSSILPERMGVCDRPNPTSAEAKALLSELRNKRLEGKKITKDEYRIAFEKLILEVDPGSIDSNGIACGEFGFVRKDLTDESKLFVKRHELEHLLQTGKEVNGEFSANLAAGIEYPSGLVETVHFSIDKVMKSESPIACKIGKLWKTFKIYFLPI